MKVLWVNNLSIQFKDIHIELNNCNLAIIQFDVILNQVFFFFFFLSALGKAIVLQGSLL